MPASAAGREGSEGVRARRERIDHAASAPTPSVARSVAIREFRPSDRDAVRDICCRTAFRNMGAAALIDDPELFGDYWCSYYTDHEPESMLVAELDGRIVGYLMGAVDTKRFRLVMARSIVPRVLARLLWRASRGRYREQPHARSFLRWLLVRSWREEPPVDVDRFPAHYHVNLARGAYGLGLYTTMATRFLDRVEGLGVTHAHGQVLDAKEGGVWDRFVREFQAEAPSAAVVRWESPSTLGRDVLGIEREMVNRAFGASVESFRVALAGMARRHRL